VLFNESFYSSKKKKNYMEHIGENTCDHRDIFVFVPLNKQIDSVPESLDIKKQGGYIVEHNPCQIGWPVNQTCAQNSNTAT
jgi:hypothetical protein